MRIIAGDLKGLRLAPVGKGDARNRLRPTSARMRTRIFDMISHGSFGNRVAGARVLDLFAGTGALGLEALSRGAEFACFVDNGAVACELIRRNIDLAGVAERAVLIRRDAARLGQWRNPPFDLVMLDPPYGTDLPERALHPGRPVRLAESGLHDCRRGFPLPFGPGFPGGAGPEAIRGHPHFVPGPQIHDLIHRNGKAACAILQIPLPHPDSRLRAHW